MLSRGEAAKRAVIVMHYQNDIVDANVNWSANTLFEQCIKAN